MIDGTDLDAELLKAHEEGNASRLTQLYTDTANQAENAGDIDAACFFLTHAYVFALEAGLPEAGDLNRRLAGHGRDVVQEDLAS